jgi:hypothetical protein
MQDIPLLWNQTGKESSDEDELRTEKTDSWVNAIRKGRTLESGRRQSHVKLTEKKYVSIWQCNTVNQNSA